MSLVLKALLFICFVYVDAGVLAEPAGQVRTWNSCTKHLQRSQLRSTWLFLQSFSTV